MDFHKTRRSARSTYTYDFVETDGISNKVHLVPGEDGITEAHIALLHRMDDREVESNLKDKNPEYSLKESELQTLRKMKAEYGEQWAKDFEREHGGRPHVKDIRGAIDDAFPKNWTSSLDEMLDGEEETDDFEDKSLLLASFDSYQVEADREYKDATDRLIEIAEQLNERQRLIYQMVLMGKKTKKAVAQEIGISDVMVGREVRKIESLIREDKILKKFFRQGSR